VNKPRHDAKRLLPSPSGRGGGSRAVIGLLAALLAGCQSNPLATLNPLSSDSSLTLKPVRGVEQTVTFNTAYYSFDQRNNLTIVLLEGDAEQPRSAATIRMYWRPQVGQTPLDAAATNATVRYILLRRDGAPTAAVYAGAGFLNPATSKGQDTFHGDLADANLRLVDAPEGFADHIGITHFAGRVTAQRDDAQTQRILRRLQKQISEQLGYPRLVSR